jgi:hypothetical protein
MLSMAKTAKVQNQIKYSLHGKHLKKSYILPMENIALWQNMANIIKHTLRGKYCQTLSAE